MHCNEDDDVWLLANLVNRTTSFSWLDQARARRKKLQKETLYTYLVRPAQMSTMRQLKRRKNHSNDTWKLNSIFYLTECKKNRRFVREDLCHHNEMLSVFCFVTVLLFPFVFRTRCEHLSVDHFLHRIQYVSNGSAGVCFNFEPETQQFGTKTRRRHVWFTHNMLIVFRCCAYSNSIYSNSKWWVNDYNFLCYRDILICESRGRCMLFHSIADCLSHYCEWPNVIMCVFAFVISCL